MQTRPPQRAALARLTIRIFHPPLARVNLQPKLVLEPVLSPAPAISPVAFTTGLPDGIGPVSGGRGGPFGIGTGSGGMGGDGSGPYEGDRWDGSLATGAGITSPVPLRTPEPEYSEAARKARVTGTVLVSIVVGADGVPRHVAVVRGLGLGLDERALEAVAHWLFKPATRNGHPVAVRANVEVNFHLL